MDLQSSIVKSLFLGNILEENLFPFPVFEAEEQETLKLVLESIDRFLEGKAELFAEQDQGGLQSEEYIESLRELGLFGLIIPEEYGGIGLSNASYARVLHQTSLYDGSTSLTIGAHSSIGMKGLLLFGTDEQKQQYLPGLATGEMIAAFCLTEPGSGSDAASISTSASKNPDGSWTLNGEKIWITNGPFADFFTVFAKTESDTGKISAFIVERSFEGVSTGPKEDKMGIRASGTCTVSFKDVRVPAENLLGEEGKGFKVAVSILNNGRTGLGGGCVGAMKRCIALSTKQAKDRKQFGRSISEFALVREKIAQMTIECYATESVVAMVAHQIDSGCKDYSVEAAISKVYASEALWRTANEALQVAGGSGFMREYPYEQIVRDSRINMIFEGTSEILRLFIGLSGMKDAGEYLKEIGKTAGNIFNDPIKGFGVLSGYATRKFSHLTSLGRDRIDGVHKELRDASEVYEKYTVELARATEVVLKKHGKGIIGRQFITKRVAEVSMDLFIGLSVLSRVTASISEHGKEKCEEEIRIANMFTAQARRRMRGNLKALEKNEDNDTHKLAEHIFDKEGFSWDTV